MAISANKSPAKVIKLLADDCWRAINMLPINPTISFTQNRERITATISERLATALGLTFKMLYQLRKWLIIRATNKATTIIADKPRYDVLIYVLAFSFSPLANASVSLFLKPYPKPTSQIFIHPIMELRVNHIPYSYELR